MGYVSKTNSMGDAVSTLTFERYEDFLRYERLDRLADDTSRQIAFTEKEYYYLCILVGHLKPGDEVVQSLLDKFDLPLDCEDYDKLTIESESGCNVLKLNEEKSV